MHWVQGSECSSSVAVLSGKRDGVIAMQREHITALQADLEQTLQDVGVAPVADLTLQHSQARKLLGRIFELEQAEEHTARRVADLEEALRGRDSERYELLVGHGEALEELEAVYTQMSELRGSFEDRILEAVSAGRSEERERCREALEPMVRAEVEQELRGVCQAATKEAVAEAEQGLLHELEQTSTELVVMQESHARMLEELQEAKEEAQALRVQLAQLERQRRSEARRHKKAAAKGAQAAVAALAGEFSAMVHEGVCSPGHSVCSPDSPGEHRGVDS